MISVVIPAYNEEKNIANCLNALVSQTTKKPFEVIVVDNNSTDKTAQIIKGFHHQLHLMLIHEKRKGRGAARYAGFKIANGDIILSTDADTIVPANWVETMANYFNNPSVVAVTGVCKYDDCSRITNALTSLMQPITMRLYNLFIGHYWLSGFNFAIRKSVYERAGGFNPELNGMEDIDLSFRVSRMGEIMYVPHLPVVASGRRFQKGITKGLYSYGSTYLNRIFLNRGNGYMSDIR